jgi:hypothetical protein
VFIFFAQFFWRLLLDYKITNSDVEIRVFGLPFKIDLIDIEEVRKVSFRELLPWKNPKSVSWLRLGNKLLGEGILIRRNRGIFRTVIISPDKPNVFIEEINLKLCARL